MLSTMPLHLLPPHIKLQILSSMNVQPTQSAQPQPQSDADNNHAALSASASTSSTITSASSASSAPVPSAYFTSAPLFHLSSLTPSTQLPPGPYSHRKLTQLHTHGYCYFDNFLPPSTESPYNTLQTDIDHLLATGAFTQGGMQAADSWKAADVRGDRVCWLSAANKNPSSISSLLNDLMVEMAKLSLVLRDFPADTSSSQLALYEPGGRYVRHLDVRRGGGGPVRQLTAIVYLNEGWQAEWGGQVRLYERCGETGESERSVDVLPVWGRLLLFASEEVEHEVLPATKRRIALTAWFK